jgi:hypothetical protein
MNRDNQLVAHKQTPGTFRSAGSIAVGYIGRGKMRYEYQGYIGEATFVEEDALFYGQVLHIHDVVTFMAETAAELASRLSGIGR